jgi:hypothetical protein
VIPAGVLVTVPLPDPFVPILRLGGALKVAVTAVRSLILTLQRFQPPHPPPLQPAQAAQTARVRQQIAAGQQFRRHVDAFWDACERWADAQLEAPEAASHEAAKKGGSPRPSRPKSSRRSKRS